MAHTDREGKLQPKRAEPSIGRRIGDVRQEVPNSYSVDAEWLFGGALTRKSGKSRENDRLDYAIEGDGLSGRLNPDWVEWLMGWPIGWTALQPLAMDRFLEWRQEHGCDSTDETNADTSSAPRSTGETT